MTLICFLRIINSAFWGTIFILFIANFTYRCFRESELGVVIHLIQHGRSPDLFIESNKKKKSCRAATRFQDKIQNRSLRRSFYSFPVLLFCKRATPLVFQKWERIAPFFPSIFSLLSPKVFGIFVTLRLLSPFPESFRDIHCTSTSVFPPFSVSLHHEIY